MFVVVQSVAVPNHLRGVLDRFLMEINSSLYVGTLSRKTADALWEILQEHCKTGSVTMVLSTSTNEQGYELRQLGVKGVELVDIDGLTVPLWDRMAAPHAH